MSDKRNEVTDNTYGVRHENKQWLVGDSTLEIDEKDDSLHIKCVTYAGTRGLFDLLLMKNPKGYEYNKDDLVVYKKIFKATNAHRQNYKRDANLYNNRGPKYKTNISKLFQKKGTGYEHAYI